MSSPICVSDPFHLSHYYWRYNAGSSDSDEETDTTLHKPLEVEGDDVKLKFYAHVMDDGSNNIHFGKWDGIPMDAPDAYGQASEQMTDYMFDLALSLLPHRRHPASAAVPSPEFNQDQEPISYVDLGSGTAASAMRIVERENQLNNTIKATCLNLCHEQNIEAVGRIKQRNLSEYINVVGGTFEEAPFEDESFDLAFSQDAFIHAQSKKTAYSQAFRITKAGGAFVFCDITRGDNPEATQGELDAFSKHNALNDFLDPAEIKTELEAAGWKEVYFIDLTNDLRISFQLMLKKVNFVLEHGNIGSNMNRILLRKYSQKVKDRLIQIDRGVFKWCVFHARKPVAMHIACPTPVPFVNTSPLVGVEQDKEGAGNSVAHGNNVVVVDILTKMPREKIEKLPPTVNLLVTLSAGLDHIDLQACAERGIHVRQAGREAITSHVVQYVLSFLIIGLRDALSQLGVPFPSKGWDLTWNCQQGKPLTDCKIAIVGMGVIGKTLVKQIRALAPDTCIMYHVPPQFREMDMESGGANLEYHKDLCEMVSECDVLLPMCPLTKHTTNLINAKVLSHLKPNAGLINMARGAVVDTEALTDALDRKAFKYAILDTTAPEPLPRDHKLWGLDNCFILPHFATNTMAVRQALVDEIQPIVEEFFGLGYSDEKLRQEEQVLRHDLAVAHRLTAKHGMDMLVWNHISARFKTGCLITPGRKLFNQVKPEDLVFSSSNITADIIHAAIYKARPDCQAVIHLHTPAATAVSCLESGFVPMTQDAAYFYNKVAYYEYDGVSNESSEGPAIQAAIKAMPGCNTLLMHNHGYVCFGKTIREAWVLAYYFERCCEVQLRVMQCGGKVKMPPARVMAEAAEASYLPEFAPGVCEWEALCNDVSFD